MTTIGLTFQPQKISQFVTQLDFRIIPLPLIPSGLTWMQKLFKKSINPIYKSQHHLQKSDAYKNQLHL